MVAQGWGVVKSLERLRCGPVGLVHTQNFQFFKTENPLLWVESNKTTYGHKADITAAVDVRC